MNPSTSPLPAWHFRAYRARCTLIPSLIIRTDCLRLRRDYDPHTSWHLHEEALHELKALSERVTDTREGSASIQHLYTGTLLLRFMGGAGK